MSYTFHPAAESEFLESVGYYESKVQGLGQALINEFSVLVNLIIDNPEAWQVEAKPGIRKAPLSRFPLSIIYRKSTGNIQVLAIAHHHRRPQYWLGRAL
ncbi:type II toxin-antitoxin system RelE/ParE family toxin [Idiomarina ramblicola]|uniref:Plasmid stabilization protein n=1 Tax=Idiomarina ramblicola TaxID=263724 RepID=A0A432Z5Y5_9GAMM|nr:type II toxin-antitoxin system RelE/ParE family toxin [Idiomarina ramblicola]RUO73296.1 hypothetical protein CWI78_02280 [Idiomarina ramblicola]